MNFEAKGIKVTIDPNEQSNQAVLDTIQEFADVAKERGLELPFVVGTVAVESTVDTERLHRNLRVESECSGQVEGALEVYESVVDQLNSVKAKKEQITIPNREESIAAFDAWFTPEKLDYVAKAMEADPELSFTLVASPNVLVTPKQLKELAKKFSENQPYPTDVWDELYDKYSALQLSGTVPEGDIKFCLIPNKFTVVLDGPVLEQRGKLAKLQTEQPFLRVPSVLEAVTFWNTLRIQGDSLASGNVFNRTYIRHFDLEERRFDDELCVPDSAVGDVGRPFLGYSDARDDDGARVAVG
jgi:hypothetical protein